MQQARREKIRLGDLLVQHQIISADQLSKAIEVQQKTGGKLGNILIELRFIDEQALLNFLAKQLQIPIIDLRYYPFDLQLIRKIPESIARRFRVILLAENNDNYVVGMAEPQDIFAHDELMRILDKPMQIALVSEADLLNSLDTVYRRTEEISQYASELSETMVEENNFDLARLNENMEGSDVPVVKLLQSIFEDAVQIRASDIHIEPDEKILRIRQRVDGELQEHIMKETRIAAALTQRLKLMAGLNIAERRLPMEGRFSVRVHGKIIDVRLSTMPIQHGESIVMRLLDRSSVIYNFSDLGMPAELINEIKRLIHIPYGMILVTGPTGSGKTTTLYTVLNELNQKENKIITVEDPVEYRLARVNQVQVNPQIQLDFARALRAAMRQDPDVIMIGEIRDQETVRIALRAALTGHLVIATMHTNDTSSTAIRLMDMGSEGYLVADVLRAVLAQRLVRRVCQNCATSYIPNSAEQNWLLRIIGMLPEVIQFKQGQGCAHCNFTGYKGRIGVYELLELDTHMTTALSQNNTAAFKQAVDAKQIRTLEQASIELATQGITTLSEVMGISIMLEESNFININAHHHMSDHLD